CSISVRVIISGRNRITSFTEACICKFPANKAHRTWLQSSIAITNDTLVAVVYRKKEVRVMVNTCGVISKNCIYGQYILLQAVILRNKIEPIIRGKRLHVGKAGEFIFV
uniref:Uncharacterized protein n=1 Tax=Parascaris univalens TaxID=6257 RepID=A0A914ZZ46_PARUN